ncbi:MAG: hypothetical protein PHU42_04160 [Patescibacteria group bacterium]|nr:hypothetical protein [Patescibacteria group bacterium]
MSDTNKNGQIDPDEAAGIVDEEEVVNEALIENKINDEEAAKVETLDALEKEAQKIEMEEGMGSPAVVADINAEDISVEAPAEEKPKPEEQPTTSNIPTPAEVVQEISKEPTQEVAKEISPDSEASSEFKKL